MLVADGIGGTKEWPKSVAKVRQEEEKEEEEEEEELEIGSGAREIKTSRTGRGTNAPRRSERLRDVDENGGISRVQENLAPYRLGTNRDDSAVKSQRQHGTFSVGAERIVREEREVTRQWMEEKLRAPSTPTECGKSRFCLSPDEYSVPSTRTIFLPITAITLVALARHPSREKGRAPTRDETTTHPLSSPIIAGSAEADRWPTKDEAREGEAASKRPWLAEGREADALGCAGRGGGGEEGGGCRGAGRRARSDDGAERNEHVPPTPRGFLEYLPTRPPFPISSIVPGFDAPLSVELRFGSQQTREGTGESVPRSRPVVLLRPTNGYRVALE
ncbi:hypothetical protein KM043_012269 [Ampulex compressa]|nr:hypothetical protein KM043_012269 [Ampulex compressa]